MTLTELLAEAVHRLERAQIPYMVTGSVASTYHGERWVGALGLAEAWRRAGGADE